MHFFYVKSSILREWSNVLHKNYVPMFTSEHSLLRRSILLRPPGQPSNPASPPTRPAIPPSPHQLPPHPALHPTRPASPPCLPAFPDSLAVLLSHNGVACVAKGECPLGPPAKALCVGPVGCRSTCNPLQCSTHTIKYPTYSPKYFTYPLQYSTYPLVQGKKGGRRQRNFEASDDDLPTLSQVLS